MEQPNILFILTDQQAIGAMSAAGNAYLNTPAMDSLAAKGVSFSKSWCPSPVCGPARASIFSGQMPHQFGLELNGGVYPEGMRTVGTSLRDIGYKTTYIGKWHVNHCYPQEEDYIIGFENIPIHEVEDTSMGVNADAYSAQKAEKYLSQHHEQPFFLTVSLLNPHDICYHIMEMNGDKLDQFRPGADDVLPPLPENFSIPAAESDFLRYRRYPTNYGKETGYIHDWDEQRYREYLYTYYRMTERVDQHIASVLEALEKSPYRDNTIIVFTSDHGESMAAHRLVVKVTPYQEALSVPMIICDPRRPELGGTVNRDWHVSGVDLAPTFLEFAGASPEAQHIGRSFAPALDGIEDPRGYQVAEIYPSRERPEASARTIRKDSWKYTACSSEYGFEEQLVNLEQDPGEMHDSLGSQGPGVIRQRKKMVAALIEWLDRTNDPFPRHNLGSYVEDI